MGKGKYGKINIWENKHIGKLKLNQFKTFQLLDRDDNVHFENSLLFAAELFRNNVVFRQHSYPDVIILCSVKVVPSSANPKYFFYLLQPPRGCKCNRGCKGNLLPLTQNMNSFLRSRIALPTTADTFMKQWSNSSWNVFMRAFENRRLLNCFKSFSRTLLVDSNIFQKVVFNRLCSS